MTPPGLSLVRTEGGGSKNQPILRTNSTENADERGGGGVKNPENFVDVLNGWPLIIHANDANRYN